jgi:predicted AAA+ superfamily ATPase
MRGGIALGGIMKRLIEPALKEWRDNVRRKPLIIRGARQVGKTWSVEHFGKTHFDQVVTIDLERNREWHRVFEPDLAAARILAELEVLTSRTIRPGSTLLFFDEIQSCPRALMALRYFYEELPDLHLAAAGSLLEFALDEISFPVGRVQFLDMHPMTFAEYLWATGQDQLAGIVQGTPGPVPDAIHSRLLTELRTYCFIGGMPEAVTGYTRTGSIQEARSIHAELCEAYRHDFAKYARRSDPDCLEAVFTGIARHLGQQVKYTHLTEVCTSPTVKRAVTLLTQARIITRVPAASPAGLPLSASASEKKFKAILLDVGLWQHLSGLNTETAFAVKDLLDVYRGALAEQFVGQEMMVTQDSKLYYWAREAKSSSAEVDYLVVADGSLYGVEVKSGAAGRLKSLHLLLREYPDCSGGLVFTSAPYTELTEQKLTFIPLYFAGAATRSSPLQH